MVASIDIVNPIKNFWTLSTGLKTGPTNPTVNQTMEKLL